MKNAVALIAVAGMASVAAAQNFSIDLTPSASSVAEGTSFTVSVYGNADQGTHLLGGEFSLVSGSGLIDSMTWSNAAWSGFNTDGGYAGGGDYNSVIFGQLVIPPIFPPAPGTVLVLSLFKTTNSFINFLFILEWFTQLILYFLF